MNTVNMDLYERNAEQARRCIKSDEQRAFARLVRRIDKEDNPVYFKECSRMRRMMRNKTARARYKHNADWRCRKHVCKYVYPDAGRPRSALMKRKEFLKEWHDYWIDLPF